MDIIYSGAGGRSVDWTTKYATSEMKKFIFGSKYLETRKKATEHIFSVAEKFLKPILKKHPFALSMEMRNIDPELSPKVNSIPNFMKESQDV